MTTAMFARVFVHFIGKRVQNQPVYRPAAFSCRNRQSTIRTEEISEFRHVGLLSSFDWFEV